MTLTTRYRRYALLLLLFFTAHPAQSLEYEAGEVVIRHGMVDDDLYLAGGQVDLYAAVTGDAVVAGGQLNLEGDIGEDLLAAGGTIVLRGAVNDDVRSAGGELRFLGEIGDDLLAAGGRVHLGPVANVKGSAWLSGGDIRVDGTVKQGLRASGGRVVITGTIDGNVELWAEQVIIENTALITGDLIYKSPAQASIASGARINGKVAHTPVDIDLKPVMVSAVFAGLVVLFSIMLTAVVLYLVFPDFSMRVSRSVGEAPWQSLGTGLAVFAGVPVLSVILLSTVIGVWLALILLAIYLVLLLTGYFLGALFVANAALGFLGKTDVSKTIRALSLAVAIIALAVINLVPFLGALAGWIVLLAGVGALSRQLYYGYHA
jgi:hypothetical protein